MSSSGCSHTGASIWRPQPKAACYGDYHDDDEDNVDDNNDVDDDDVDDDNNDNDDDYDGDDDGTEDCLHLAVHTPWLPSGDHNSKLPVVVTSMMIMTMMMMMTMM